VVGKIPWRQTMQASVDEHSQLEVDAFRRPQPVKVSRHRCDVLVPRRWMYQSGGGVEQRLKSTELGLVTSLASHYGRRAYSRCGHSFLPLWFLLLGSVFMAYYGRPM